MEYSNSISPTPIPKSNFHSVKCFVIMVVVFVEALFNSILYPFVAYMVQDFFSDLQPGKETDKIVSFYSGLIASSFSLAQFLSSLLWGRVSDKFGRRLTILLGLFFNTITAPLFGLAQTYSLAIVFRSLSGIVNGNLAVAKAYAKEITDDSNISQVFSYLGFAWGFGIIIGPFLGGLLSHISYRLPEVFPSDSIWETYPYFLPMLLCSFFSFIGFVLGLFSIENLSYKFEQKAKPSSLMKNKEFIICTAVYGLSTLVFLGFEEVFPYWCKARRESGGLELADESTIGYIQAIGGIAVITFELIFVPKAHSYFGLLKVLEFSMYICIPVFFLTPFFNMTYGNFMYVGVSVFYLLFAAVQSCVLTSIGIAINNTVNSSILGTANGFAETTVSFFRFIGPAAYGGIFGWSVDSGYNFPLNAHLIFVFSSFLGVGVLVLMFKLKSSINKRKHERDLHNPMFSPLLGH